MKTLRMHTGCFTHRILTAYRIGMGRNYIMKITFRNKADSKKYQQQGRTNFLYGRFSRQRLAFLRSYLVTVANYIDRKSKRKNLYFFLYR